MESHSPVEAVASAVSNQGASILSNINHEAPYVGLLGLGLVPRNNIYEEVKDIASADGHRYIVALQGPALAFISMHPSAQSQLQDEDFTCLGKYNRCLTWLAQNYAAATSALIIYNKRG